MASDGLQPTSDGLQPDSIKSINVWSQAPTPVANAQPALSTRPEAARKAVASVFLLSGPAPRRSLILRLQRAGSSWL